MWIISEFKPDFDFVGIFNEMKSLKSIISELNELKILIDLS